MAEWSKLFCIQSVLPTRPHPDDIWRLGNAVEVRLNVSLALLYERYLREASTLSKDLSRYDRSNLGRNLQKKA